MMTKGSGSCFVVISLLVIFLLPKNYFCFHYFIDESKRCFSEEVAETASLIILYSVQYHDIKSDNYLTHNDVGVRLTIQPTHGHIQTDVFLTGASNYKFRASDYNTYTFCFEKSSKTILPKGASSKPLKLNLIFEYENEGFESESTKETHLTKLEQEIVWTLDLSAQMLREQERCLDMSESLNKINKNTMFYIIASMVIQFALVIAVAVWQLRHLKSFIRAKKLV